MHAFRRVFWKESRVQAHIWIALAIGVLLLQGIVVSSELVHQSYISPGVVTALFVVTSVIGVCYAAASASILIAGEREDETAFLLRTFPIPRTALLGGKLSFTVTSLLALLLFGFVSAACLGGLFGRDRLTIPGDLWTYSRSIGGAIAWGLLFSLLVERVMVALGLAIGTEIVVVGILGNFLPAEWREPVYWTIVPAILILDLVLAARWLAGESLAPASLWKPSTAVPRAEWSTRWLRLLQQIVGSGSPERRATGTLVWRELRGAVPFALVWFVVGVVLVDFVMRMRDKFPAHFLFLALTPGVCGLMTALGDQRKSLFRFYADRGISPLRIWSVKIGTWLSVAAAFLILFGWYDATFTGRFDRTFGHPIGSVFQGIEQSVRMQLTRLTWAPTEGLTFLHWNFLLSVSLMLFTIGQWGAFLRRQAVVAVALTIGLGFVAIAWHFVVISANLPLLWTTWPITLAGLAATAWNSSRWLEEDHRWPTTLRRAAWLVVPILAVLVTARTLRITAIPAIEIAGAPVPVRNSLVIHFRNPETTRLLSEYPGSGAVVQQQSFRTSDGATLWKITQTARDLVSPLPPPEPTSFLPGSEDGLNALLPPGEAAPSETEPPAAAGSPSTEVKPDPKEDQDDKPPELPAADANAAATGPAAAGQAGAEPASGENGAPRETATAPTPIDSATLATRWDGLLDLIGAADRAAEGAIDWYGWIEAVETRQKVLLSARAWGRLPGQSVERLDAAILSLEGLHDAPSAAFMLRNRQSLWRAYASGEPLSSWGAEFPPIGGKARFFLALIGERSRSLRLAEVMTDAALTLESRRVGEPSQLGLFDDNIIARDQTRIGRWLASTTLVPYSFRFEPIASESDNRTVVIHRQNAVAARLGTLTCLLLQRYRLQHGEFPARLADLAQDSSLLPEELSRLTRDPFTGDELRYRREGFPASVRLDFQSGTWQQERTISIPADQPLLWSAGPGLRSIVPGSVRPATYLTSQQRRADTWSPGAVGDFAKELHADQVDFLILPP